MAEVIPFSGLRYNLDKVGDISRVTTPPYDVISSEDQEGFYDASEYNIIRLELGKEYPGDNQQNNKYTRASDFLEQWIKEGILLREAEPALYIYEQHFNMPDGQPRVRRGVIGLVRLEEFSKGVILPHENTLSKPKADRLNLMRACRANFSQVFALYDDSSKRIPNLLEQYSKMHQPCIETDEGIWGNVERLWSVCEPSLINEITEILSDNKLFIADGHHRYETALNFRDEFKRNNPHHTGNELYNYVMMMLVEFEDPGLLILPTHRLVKNLYEFNMEDFLAGTEKHFTRKSYKFQGNSMEERADQLNKTLNRHGVHSFAFYDGNKDNFSIVSLKDTAVMKDYCPGRDESYRELDVSILHTLILEPLLGIGEKALADQEHLSYTHDILDGMRELETGKQQAAAFMIATSIEQMKNVSLAGEKMPQKSTYFYPKLLTGLVINKF